MIGAATADDADWITSLWNEVIADTFVTFTTEPKSQTAIAEMIATRPVLVLPDAMGFATYGPFRAGPGYAATIEHTILLSPRAQGQGHGRTLLTALMNTARGEQKHIMVAGISGANPGAIAFHAALGFQQVAQMPEVGRKGGQWLDLILMQKQL
ncbi:MAG: N-acetyltransferase family protein [Tateyamaria sp.]|uniref:GNAT family N-acetyltransferase n=1 Tax=Tateyamaria sp. TaxID=1929288 RepID=UPI003270C5BA